MSPSKNQNDWQISDWVDTSDALTSPWDRDHAPLAEELARDWELGQRVLAEEILKRHPSISDNPGALIRVLYEEICQRRQRGETVSEEELIHRFPSIRQEIELLLAGHDLMESMTAPACWPAIGEQLGAFRLTKILGRGATGRVYLAMDTVLADRRVVIKATQRQGIEHLKLARLQHTYIVPLFSASDDLERNLRLLCMPYLGGGSLDQMLRRLARYPRDQRRGDSLLQVLEEMTNEVHAEPARETSSRRFFRRATFEQAICWIGVCLAEALQYAHDQGLVHLDIKPGNILITLDAQAMLLDFHLARYPIVAGTVVEQFGGTHRYMSPEHRQAFETIVTTGRSDVNVGPAADIYSLGLVLAECLGLWQADDEKLSRDRRSTVTQGLYDIVRQCLHANPARRYQSAGDLAEDLRRHLADRALRNTPNRSLVERVRKWRRRNAHGPLVAILSVALVVGLAAQGWIVWKDQRQLLERAQVQQTYADQLAQHGDFDQAIPALQRSLSLSHQSYFGQAISEQTESKIRAMKQRLFEQRIIQFADRVRFLSCNPNLDQATSSELAVLCESNWNQLVLPLGRPNQTPACRESILDIGLLWADFASHAQGESHSADAAIQVIKQIQKDVGNSSILEVALRHYLGDDSPEVDASNKNRTVHLRFLRGRWLYLDQKYSEAVHEFEWAARQRPRDFWAWLYLGLGQFHLGEFDRSAASLTVAIALRPDTAECYLHRANAYLSLDQQQKALWDLDHSLELAPAFGPAFLNRGILYLKRRDYRSARRDLEQSLAVAQSLGSTHYHLALLDAAEGNVSHAREHARQAAAYHYPEAERLTTLLLKN